MPLILDSFANHSALLDRLNIKAASIHETQGQAELAQMLIHRIRIERIFVLILQKLGVWHDLHPLQLLYIIIEQLIGLEIARAGVPQSQRQQHPYQGRIVELVDIALSGAILQDPNGQSGFHVSPRVLNRGKNNHLLTQKFQGEVLVESVVVRVAVGGKHNRFLNGVMRVEINQHQGHQGGVGGDVQVDGGFANRSVLLGLGEILRQHGALLLHGGPAYVITF